MFGSLTLLIAVVGLATLSAGSLAYALLYGRIQNENATERRLDIVQGHTPVEALRGRANTAGDAARRRKSVQDTLREIEEKQKARSKRTKSPPLVLRMEQAGLNWSRRTFLLISLFVGLATFVGHLGRRRPGLRRRRLRRRRPSRRAALGRQFPAQAPHECVS